LVVAARARLISLRLGLVRLAVEVAELLRLQTLIQTAGLVGFSVVVEVVPMKLVASHLVQLAGLVGAALVVVARPERALITEILPAARAARDTPIL
jgi:hypothetical protein